MPKGEIVRSNNVIDNYVNKNDLIDHALKFKDLGCNLYGWFRLGFKFGTR